LVTDVKDERRRFSGNRLDNQWRFLENKGMWTAITLLLLVCLVPVPGFGAIYGWEDEEGVYHLTNIRPPGVRKYLIVVPDRPKPGAALTGTYRNEYDDMISRHAQSHGVDPHLVKAVMIAESNGNPQARSNKGAQGLMQIMPDTATLLELRNPFDPEENIRAGARYLKMLWEIFPNDLDLVLAAYNAGPTRVMQAKGTIPRIDETVNYIKRVKHFYNKLKNTQ
jgi:hypothetical protein